MDKYEKLTEVLFQIVKLALEEGMDSLEDPFVKDAVRTKLYSALNSPEPFNIPTGNPDYLPPLFEATGEVPGLPEEERNYPPQV